MRGKISIIFSICSIGIAILSLLISYFSFRASYRISCLLDVEVCQNCQPASDSNTILYLEGKITNLGSKSFSIEGVSCFHCISHGNQEYEYTLPIEGLFWDIGQKEKVEMPINISVEPGQQKRLFAQTLLPIPFPTLVNMRRGLWAAEPGLDVTVPDLPERIITILRGPVDWRTIDCYKNKWKAYKHIGMAIRVAGERDRRKAKIDLF